MERCEPSLTIKLGGEQYKQGGRLPPRVWEADCP